MSLSEASLIVEKELPAEVPNKEDVDPASAAIVSPPVTEGKLNDAGGGCYDPDCHVPGRIRRGTVSDRFRASFTFGIASLLEMLDDLSACDSTTSSNDGSNIAAWEMLGGAPRARGHLTASRRGTMSERWSCASGALGEIAAIVQEAYEEDENAASGGSDGTGGNTGPESQIGGTISEAKDLL